MVVPDKKHTKWLKSYDQGDIKALVAFTGKSQPTITKAIRKKIATVELMNQIDQFFDNKQAQIA